MGHINDVNEGVIGERSGQIESTAERRTTSIKTAPIRRIRRLQTSTRRIRPPTKYARLPGASIPPNTLEFPRLLPLPSLSLPLELAPPLIVARGSGGAV